jgi:hypothetical protein
VSDPSLRADCSRCAGLCCVIPAFAASADFAVDKPAGTPCRNLGADFRCGIHGELRERGFRGCTVYDCFGAGQHVVARAPEHAPAVFPVVRLLHELLWYLDDALTRPQAAELHGELRALRAETRSLADDSVAALTALDGEAHRGRVAIRLRNVSELVRAGAGAFSGAGRDLLGADLTRRDLRRADLRGALLIGARLNGTVLDRADVIGADLRAADVRGADLRGALYLTQFQVNAADGDVATRLPAGFDRPAHW